MTRRQWTVLAGLVAGLLLMLAAPTGQASAHAVLTTSDPPAGAILQAAPAEVALTFTEPIRPVAERIRITAPDGSRADAGKPSVRDKTLVIPLRPGAARGTYVVSFRVISADSHPVRGGFSYSVGQVSANTGPAGDTADTPTDPAVSVGLKAARYLGFAGLVLLVGPTLILIALYPRRLSRAVPARFAVTGVALIGASALLELYLQIPYSTGGGAFDVSAEAAREVFSSQFGAAHLVRVGALAAIAVLLKPVIAGTAGVADRALLAILGVVGLATWPISGHPAASPIPTLSVVADVAHLSAMSVWLGGLVMLFAVLLRKASDPELRAVLPVWSGWALFAVAVLVLSGTAQALIEVASVDALLGTAYGRLVLLKVGLLLIVVGVAWLSRRLVLTGFAPVTDSDEPPAAPRERLRYGVIAEVAIAAVILGVASVLVQTTPARTASANESQPAGPYSADLSGPLYRLQVNVEPAQRGPNTLHLYALTPDGSAPLTVLEWRATATQAGGATEAVDVALLPITEDHAIGQVTIPAAGTWEIRFTLRTTEIDQASVTARVPIR
jgi:copper transport protein